MRIFLASLSLLLLSLSPADGLVPWHGVWFPATGKVKGVALVIHGLNLRPARMEPLCRVLSTAGLDVLRVSLSGHGFGTFHNVTAASWLEQTGDAYRAAAQRAQRFGVPVYFVGYSLGGLLGETLLATSPAADQVHFNRVVLLAPAIALRPVVCLVKALFLFGKGFTLPSADRPSYRAHRGTPMAAYESLFRLVSMLHTARFHATNLPTMIFMRRDDELVSLQGIRRLMRAYDLSHWSISVIPNRGVPGYPRHLIIDEPSLGAAAWKSLSESMVRFLLASVPHGVPPGGADGNR